MSAYIPHHTLVLEIASTYSSDGSDRDSNEDYKHGLCISLDGGSPLVAFEFTNVVDIASDSIDGSVGVLANKVFAELFLKRLLEDRSADGDTEDASCSSVKTSMHVSKV